MDASFRISRRAKLPDLWRLERFRRAPDVGPRVLFFSGGTALRELCRSLVDYTHNSIHLITPFDSGGSSATLRKAFKMLAVGDLRNRLMALADRTVQGHPEVIDLFSFRFSDETSRAELVERLTRMVDGLDPLVREIPDPMRKLVRSHLYFFQKRMPKEFDLRGANIGNLIIAGGFLNYNRHIDPVVFLFSQLVGVKGTVRPVASEDVHLAARLENGELLVGQHRLAGKESPAIQSPIKQVFLVKSLEEEAEYNFTAREKVTSFIREAELICYPVGSFYTSIVASLLPHGIGQAIAETDVPKVYVPNPGKDPEEFGMTLADKVETLLAYLEKGCDQSPKVNTLLNFVLLDKNNHYYKEADVVAIREMGVDVVFSELSSEDSAPFFSPELLTRSLLSFV